jgi:hypothetical protein
MVEGYDYIVCNDVTNTDILDILQVNPILC